MTELTRVPHSEKISTDEWGFGFGDFDPIISKGVEEALEETLKDIPPEMWLPSSWKDSDGIGGSAVTDPLTLYLNMAGLSKNVDTGPVWSTTLKDIIQECFIDYDLSDEDDYYKEECVEHAKQIRDALRSLADYIDHKISSLKQS